MAKDRPKGGSSAERDRQMQLLQTMNQEFRERYAINSDIQARAWAYELAARMQLSARLRRPRTNNCGTPSASDQSSTTSLYLA